jgi:hypothetical protein
VILKDFLKDVLNSTLHILGRAATVLDSDPEDWFGGDDLQGFVVRNDGLSERADGGPTPFNDPLKDFHEFVAPGGTKPGDRAPCFGVEQYPQRGGANISGFNGSQARSPRLSRQPFVNPADGMFRSPVLPRLGKTQQPPGRGCCFSPPLDYRTTRPAGR